MHSLSKIVKTSIDKYIGPTFKQLNKLFSIIHKHEKHPHLEKLI